MSGLPRQSIAPQQVQRGDRFKHRGVEYEAVRLEQGRYGTMNIISRRLSLESVGFDYYDVVEVERAAS